ncbi:MAG: transposase [Saprospiraceae bacterium]|nr:transposase [Saprospiraceae bacterium]
MKSSKFTESQIIKALKENENGKTAEQISRESGIKKATLVFFPPGNNSKI